MPNELKKIVTPEGNKPIERDPDGQARIISDLLLDGQPRTKAEIIAATGIEDIQPQSMRQFPQLPDGRFTLPDSSGAWEALLIYLREKPRRLPQVFRLFKRHQEISARLTAASGQEILVRLPRGLITTSDSPEGKSELEKRHQIETIKDKLESLPHPFFIPERMDFNPAYFQDIAEGYAVKAEFSGEKYFCLRRAFPGEVVVDQLGEISGRYFAPPHTASAPAFLKEHSCGEREAANVLSLDEEAMVRLVAGGDIGRFTLDGRLRLWRSDLGELKRDGTRLRSLAKEHEKLRASEAAALLGLTTGQVRRLIEEKMIIPVPAHGDRDGGGILIRRKDIEKLRRELPAIVSRWNTSNDKRPKPEDTPGSRPPARKRPPRRKELLTPKAETLVLDDFQVEAAEALREGLSVLVSAPTGNGKTLVAEMLAKNVMAAGVGMIYTSPLKALSNQKYRDFKEIFGDDSVGLVTGDISINPGAPMLIMTTEIFRNWCLSEPEQLGKISYVVFDEIHYLDDAERGTTWEESILFAPPHIKILGLSATVPNADEMADWISSVRGGNVVVIYEKRRRVPLAIQWIMPDGRITSEAEAKKEVLDLAEDLKALRGKRRWMEE